MKTLIAASNNANKIHEIKAILSDLDYIILSLKDAGIDIDPEENGSTFEENALIKARDASKYTMFDVIADDSGLEVDCMNGLPGVMSKRFAGENSSDKDNNLYLIEKLKTFNLKKFNARFICTIAYIDNKGNELIFKGTCDGEIITKAMGSNGFGYDPFFYIPKYKKTFAQLTDEEKNAISHRGNALRALKKYLEKGNK